jgi:predicted TPR repeat methyltransferase
LGHCRAAARGFREVLALDADHGGAAWHLRALIR